MKRIQTILAIAALAGMAACTNMTPQQQGTMSGAAIGAGAGDARLDEYRWLLEELRVSLFAQELRTPQPVSAKRLDKLWSQLSS